MSVLPVIPEVVRSPLTERQRGFLLLNVFVLAQHGFLERAGVLVEAMYVLGDATEDVLLARAVLRFFDGDWAATLGCLDELDRVDPIERFGRYTVSDRQRMRRYLKARCLHEQGDTVRAKDALEAYLRHGVAPTKGN